MELRVMYVHDEEAGGWGFRVPSLGIVGGAETREEAEEQARAAILFTLEDDDTDVLPGEEADYFHVEIERPKVHQLV